MSKESLAVCFQKTLEQKYDRLIQEANFIEKNPRRKENDRLLPFMLEKSPTLDSRGGANL